MLQATLFTDAAPPPPPPTRRALPTLGAQKDIQYLATTARSILNGPAATGMSYWSLNPYVGCAFGCTYCYARYAHRYVMERALEQVPDDDAHDLADLPPWLAFERRVLVKQDAPALLRRALRPGTATHRALTGGQTVVIGTATDPYQPAERRFRLTRAVLEVLAEQRDLSVVIITKSPLVTRDADVLARIARHSSLSVHVSLITLDRELARRIEPRAPTPESRLRAVRRLREAGVDVCVNCMPVLPGITDAPADIERLVAAVADAGATHLAACALRLQSTARQRYVPFIAQEFPQLAARYRATYARGYQAGDRYRAGLRHVFARLCRRHGIHFGMPEQSDDEMAEISLAAQRAAGVAQLELVLEP